jgi:hypothetical protein
VSDSHDGRQSQQVQQTEPAGDDTSFEEEPVADRLTIAVMVLLGVMVVLSGFLAFATYNRSLALDASLDYSTSGYVTEAAERELAGEDLLLATAMRLFALGVLATAPLFIIWQHRHARVADSLAPQEGVARPAWAIAGWFVPVANLWLPGMQLYRSSKASDPNVPLGGPAGHVRGNERVKAWAVALGLSVGAELLAGNAQPDSYASVSEQDAIDGYVQAETFRSIGAIGLSVAAVLGVLMVRELQRTQDAKLMRSLGGQPDPTNQACPH